MLLTNRSYYIELAREPAPVERLTFLSLLAVGAVSMLIAYRLSRPTGWRNRQVVFFALFAGALGFMAMEEISWGQRILDLEIPQFFLEYNAQENINLHNILHTYTSIRTHQINPPRF